MKNVQELVKSNVYIWRILVFVDSQLAFMGVSVIKAMIMAAGVGSRLEPLTHAVPKPMVPILDKPVMEYIVRLLKQHGVTDIIANLHYLPDKIKEYFFDGSDFGVKMHYSLEEELLGTAGGVKNNEWFLDETFIVISGDALTNIDITAAYAYHKRKQALATIVLKEVDDVSQFGVVALDSQGKISQFQEKPAPEQAISNLANTGIYIFEPEIFKYIPPATFFDFGKDLFPKLVERELPFYGVDIGHYWSDIGTILNYIQGNFDMAAGKVQGIKKDISLWHPEAVIEEPGDILGPVFLGRGAYIERGAIISGPAVIGEHCHIKSGTVVDKSIIWPHTKVGNQSQLFGCVVGYKVIIGDNVTVKHGAVLGSGCTLSEETVAAGDLVWPNKMNVKSDLA
ncbi:NDP-sugar synthase [Metallumcola ferriviriculae]|uniref:NDP-sugar synthase n=1 Tax=Metallumcola ferriviriculae TaxID=3039180 RepID=A0AAU0UK38_9FIRM|nr:NDP-sugar synthase [Desulfitibacteraceae bacterium MK1]